MPLEDIKIIGKENECKHALVDGQCLHCSYPTVFNIKVEDIDEN